MSVVGLVVKEPTCQEPTESPQANGTAHSGRGLESTVVGHGTEAAVHKEPAEAALIPEPKPEPKLEGKVNPS